MKLFSGDYLFQTPAVEPSAFFGILTAGFAVLFLAGALAYWRRGKLAPGNPPLKNRIRRIATAAMWYAGVGLFLAAMRYAEIPYIGMPLWMFLLLLAMIATVAYYVYDFSERYPLAVWRLQESTVQRRYRPVVRQRVEPQRARPAKVRGKRRR